MKLLKSRGRRGGHYVDTRITVDLAGDWKACTDTLPKGCTVHGTVTDAGKTGALVRLAQTRNYVRVSDGKIISLYQRGVEMAIEAATRDSNGPLMVSVEEWQRERG